jgi:hypothetical protein
MFDFVDVDQEREQGWDYSQKGSELLKARYDVIDWLKDEKLFTPLNLKSAYAHVDEIGQVIGESLPFTNVSQSFVDTLDYIWYGHGLVPTAELYVPKSFRELNKDEISNGHLLPSDVWPSDHLAVGARLRFQRNFDVVEQRKKTEGEFGQQFTFSASIYTEDASIEGPACLPVECEPPAENQFCWTTGDAIVNAQTAPAASRHDQRCRCGCVPNILSLFEMAELRKRAKLKNQRQDSD